MTRKKKRGYVYLIHFTTPLGHAQHYRGWTEDLEARIKAHRETTWEPCEPYQTDKGGTARGHKHGEGATILAACNYYGITWEVVRTWKGTLDLEARMRKTGHNRRICPACNPGTTNGHFDKPPKKKAVKKDLDPVPTDWPVPQAVEYEDAEIPF